MTWDETIPLRIRIPQQHQQDDPAGETMDAGGTMAERMVVASRALTVCVENRLLRVQLILIGLTTVNHYYWTNDVERGKEGMKL